MASAPHRAALDAAPDGVDPVCSLMRHHHNLRRRSARSVDFHEADPIVGELLDEKLRVHRVVVVVVALHREESTLDELGRQVEDNLRRHGAAVACRGR